MNSFKSEDANYSNVQPNPYDNSAYEPIDEPSNYSTLLLAKTYLWMFFGILISAASSFSLYYLTYTGVFVLSTPIIYVAMIAEIIIVFVFSFTFRSLSAGIVTILYFTYAILNGVTLSLIFFNYELSSIFRIFIATAIVFGVMAFLGKTINIDLTKYRYYFVLFTFIALVLSVVNMFMQSSQVDIYVSLIIIMIFAGVTMYDVKKILALSSDPDLPQQKLAIYGAMELYLDFINIFLRFVRLFGNKRN